MHTLPDLGITFSVPPNFIRNSKDEKSEGETGTSLYICFQDQKLPEVTSETLKAKPCGTNALIIATVSKDYSAGRGGVFSDFTGYVKRGDKFYPRFIDSADNPYPPEITHKEITTANGITYLYVLGVDNSKVYPEEEWDGPFMGTPGKGKVGALVNLSHPTYSGFNISLPINSPEDEEIFNRILSSFVLMND